jgi:VWFA-related protein
MKQRTDVLWAVIGCVVVTGAVLALAMGAGAQFTFHRTVRRVVVDVVVTDKNHNEVHGLQRKDFTVYEDNREQELRSFEAFNLKSDAAFVPPPVPRLPPDTYMNVPPLPEVGPLYVIVYDAVHMSRDDQVFARAQLEKFVNAKPPGTRFEMYLLSDDLRLVQSFTTDPQKMLEVFDVKRKDGHIPWVFLYGANYGSADFSLPFQVMGYIAHNLQGLPGRKNLIWMSSGFPVPFEGGSGIAPGANGLGGTGMGGLGGSASANMDTLLQQEKLREAADALNYAQVAIYPINVGGLNPQNAWGGIDPVAQQIADTTGGKAYYNNNTTAAALTDATENGGSYYELTYSPPDHEFDGKLHKIRVELANQGYSLSYRQYYFADDPDKPLTKAEKEWAEATANQIVAHKQGDSMFAYMVRGAPMAHDVLFKAEIHPGRTAMATPDQMADLQQQPAFFVLRKRNKPAKVPPPIPLRPYAIDYLVLDQAGLVRPGQQVLEFAACAYDSDGKMLNGLSQYAVRISDQKPKKIGEPLFRGTQVLEVPTTALWLRIAVRDVATDKIGTLELRLPLTGEAHAGAAESADAGQSNDLRPTQ